MQPWSELELEADDHEAREVVLGWIQQEIRRLRANHRLWCSETEIPVLELGLLVRPSSPIHLLDSWIYVQYALGGLHR